MKNTLLLILVALLLGACSAGKGLQRSHPHVQYFPAELSNLYFGMSKNEALQARKNLPQMEDDSGMDFRLVYLEEINQDGIEFVVYYFDNEGNLPLYELIIQYQSENLLDQAAGKLLGKPNYVDNTEWLFDTGEGFQVQAWKFQKKLVIIGKLPGSEWDE